MGIDGIGTRAWQGPLRITLRYSILYTTAIFQSKALVLFTLPRTLIGTLLTT